MRITVFGATGRVGTLFIAKALSEGHSITAYARSPQKIQSHPRISVVSGDLSDAGKIEEAVRGANAVVSLIGPVGKQTKLIFAPAYEHIVRAMKKHAVPRLIALGTPTIPDKNDRFSLIFFSLIVIVGLIIQKGGEDIQSVGTIVRNSGLKWTLVRTPLFTNGKKTKKITVGYFGNGVWWPLLSRQNFVDFVFAQLTDTTHIGSAPAISN